MTKRRILIPPGICKKADESLFHTNRVRPEEEIMRTWGSTSPVVVSICCATFNHVKYIEDALKGFLAQETLFPFEIIVLDDASTDGTTEIIKNYALRYPRIIRLVLNTENQFKKGIKSLHIFPSLIDSEYCALCEGDDFWISTKKLQQQVELLQEYPQAVMSVALTHIFQQDGDVLHYVETTKKPAQLLLGLEQAHGYYFHTSTYVIRSAVLENVVRQHFDGHVLFGDTALRAIMISIGKFALLSDVVSVYRNTGKGIWSSLDREEQLLWEIKVTKKLATSLSGIHSRYQRKRLYSVSVALLKLYFKCRDIRKGVSLLPIVFWYGLMHVLHYLSRHRV